MKELIIPIENWLNKAFPNDELDLLSYYFGYQLSSHNKLNKQRPRAVVVCTNGVMVSKLVRANMEKLFPEIHFWLPYRCETFTSLKSITTWFYYNTFKQRHDAVHY